MSEIQQVKDQEDYTVQNIFVPIHIFYIIASKMKQHFLVLGIILHI